MGGEPDSNIALVCKSEDRIIVTLDIGFADIRTYPPQDFPGIIVIRSKAQDKFSLIECFEKVIPLLRKESPVQKLWIIERDKVRIRE
jgi:predicted nuclease of predicted toxin-antitoxin system